MLGFFGFRIYLSRITVCLGVVAHAYNPSTWDTGWRISEFEASLVYRMGGQMARCSRATFWNQAKLIVATFRVFAT